MQNDTSNIPVVFMPAGIDACALWRQYFPHLNIDDSLFIIPTARLSNGQNVPGPIDLNEIGHCKVAIVQRLVSELNLKAMNSLKEAGLKVVYDIDDDLWNLPSYNPSKGIFDSMGSGFYQCAAAADILTVSTRGLKTAAQTNLRLNKEIMVVPNAVDLNFFRKKNIDRSDGTVVIGWGGSNTHSNDVREAFDCVVDVLDNNPNVRMHIVGAPAIDQRETQALNEQGRRIRTKISYKTPIANHKQSRFSPWIPVAEYGNRFASWGWDIALAPLEDNRFNRSKSAIKILEAAAIEIPCLVSDVQPYREFCALGGDDLKWLLCSTSSQWKNKLTVLINEPERREYLAKKMYEVASTWFNIKTIKENWKYVFQTVLNS